MQELKKLDRDGREAEANSIDIWLLHKGVGADDYVVRLGAMGMLPVPFPRPVRIAAGRTDLSRRRLLERIVHAMRETGAHGEDRMIDLSGIELEFVCIDELIVLASSFDNQVRSMEGRVPGYFLPTALAREAASIGGPWLTEGVRRGVSLATPEKDARESRWTRKALGKVELDAEPVKREAKEEEKRNKRKGWFILLTLVATSVLSAILTGMFAPSIRDIPWTVDKIPSMIAISFLFIIVYLSMPIYISMIINWIKGANEEEEESKEEEKMTRRARYTNRFRDEASGRIGTFKGGRGMNLVRWKDEPGRLEEMTDRATEKLERFEGSLIVNRAAGREGVIEGRVERIEVTWDGRVDVQLLDERMLESFMPLARATTGHG